ncbi:LysR family transcriptional regulator [Roseomonas sp. M0104]|uniref:LysR family transcriptional regulator n=1 Tax=Teichococcus coralli TaxID=2545983 RepID=A0A845B7L3_9PROT|nr:LysR family transcriptional regulator [Pseudoroseomonas coralli]MXP62240.1 LysR family transcriptional regulator [Pseudoroseomonas coralli]
MLDLAHIRSFVALAEELHFGRAARRLNMTQPPLSRQIQLLEAELGVGLFDRSRHAVALTASGHAFLPEARALLGATERAAQVARRAAQGRGRGVVNLGFIGASTYAFLPRLIEHTRTELPDMEIVLKEMDGATQLEALRVGRLDIGLVRPFPMPDIVSSTCVMHEGLALALPLGHPLSTKRRVGLRDLNGEAFVMYSTDGPYMHALLSNTFAAAGVQPRVVQAVSQAHTILSLVGAGTGLALVPEEARNASFDSVTFRPIAIPAAPLVELHAIWRPDNANPALEPLRDLLRRIALPRL